MNFHEPSVPFDGSAFPACATASLSLVPSRLPLASGESSHESENAPASGFKILSLNSPAAAFSSHEVAFTVTTVSLSTLAASRRPVLLIFAAFSSETDHV